MPRSNPQYYISPTAVSITPNANNSVNDLAINVARDTRIKIYVPEISADYRTPTETIGKGLDYVDNEVQSWKLRSRNRRLRFNGKYNIYARLNKEDHEDAYLVFSVNDYVLTENTTTEDLVREDGSVCPAVIPDQTPDSHGARSRYWWVKIGEVGAVAEGTREITLDTGILGTEEYNNEWQHNPDTLPLRVVLTTSKTSGQTAAPPFVPNDDSITVTAALTEGWSIDANSRADHWTVRRDSGDATADAAWNAQAAMDGRTIQLLHYPDTHDDFGEAAANVFTFSAIDADGNVLASASLSIIAEQPSSVYNAYLDFNAFTLTVDDVGNVIGGLWKSDTMVVDSDEEEVRDYRVHAAAFAMKGADFLALAPLGAAPGKGEYQLYPSDDGQCSIVIENGTIYVTGIENIYDGDASTSEDIDFDAMRAMKEATATVVVNFENRATQVLSLGITLYHEPTPFIELSLDNHTSHISWSTRHGHYHGMPVEMNIGLQRNNNRLDIAAIAIYDGNTIIAYSSADTDSSDSSDESAPGTWDIAINRATGHIAILGVPTDIAEITELDIHATTTYAGVSYERSIVHTLRKTTDTNVFEIWPSQAVITQRYAFTQSSGTLVRSVVMDINGGALSFYVSCDNDQDEHYHLTPTQMQDEGLKAFYALVRNGSESARTEIAVTATLTAQQLAGASRVIFYLVRNAGTASEFIEDMQPVEITAPVTDGITIGLYNDTDSVVYDEVGRLIGTMPETRAYLRFGDVDISTLATWSVTLVNCTRDTTVQLPALKIASVTKTVQQDSTLAPIYADIKATYDNEEYTARFAIACVTNGKHKYWMELSDEIIIYDEEDGSILPQTMDVRLRQNPGEDFDGEEQDIDVNIGASDSDQITLGEGSWTIPAATLLDFVERALADGTPRITFDWIIEGVTESETVNIVRNVKGKDGTLVEYIFRRGTKSPTDTIAPDTTFWQDTDTGGYRWQGAWTQDGVTHDPSQDDFVPRGWTDDAVGVDSANNYEWCAYRTKNANGTWGAFRSPFTFAVYGRSAAYYTEQEFAWSKDKSTASATTAPDLEGGSWTSYTPAQPSAAKPFLWMRTRRWTFQEQQNTYTSSSWTYTRLTGESGTGIALSGSFVLSDWSPTYPDIPTYLAAAHPSPSTGECYIYQEDGHLWVWNGTAWQDVGQIKGDPGVSQYIHIAWAHSLGTGTDWTDQGTGFVTAKAAADVYEYIGILANEDPNADPDITHAGEYTWDYVKGPQGDPGVSVVELDLDNELDTLLYSSSAMTTPVGSLPRTTWTLMQGRNDISSQVASADITFQTTGCNAAWVTGTAKRTLEVTNFTGASVTTAKVEVRVTFGDNTYVKVLSVKRLVDEDKYELVCTPNNIIVNTNDPATTTTCNVKVYKTSPVTGQRSLVTQLTGARYLFVNPVADGGTETGNPVTGYGSSGYSWTADKTKAAYHIMLATAPTIATAAIIDSETIPIAKVQNGRNVVRVDLTNGMDSILYNSSNLNAPTSGVLLPKTQVKVYDGDVDVTEMLGTGAIMIYSYENVPAPGATLGPTLNGNELTVNHVTAASATVTLRVEYGGTYYYATFSVKRLVDQDKYELQCDPDHFACNTTTQTGTTQTCRVYVYKTDAVTGQRTLVSSLSGLYLYYSSSQSQQLTPLGTYSSGVSFDASSTNDYYRIYLLDAQPTAQSPYTDHIVDTETLPFTKVADGKDAMVADLDNEMDAIPADSDGKLTANVTLTTYMRLFKGGQKVTLTTSNTSSRSAGSINGKAASLSVISSGTHAGEIQVQWSLLVSDNMTFSGQYRPAISFVYNGTTYSATFTATTVRSGAPGVSPVIYQLLPSLTEVVFSKNSAGTGYTPSSVNVKCGYTENSGGTIASHPDEVAIGSSYKIYYRKDSNTSYTALTTSGVTMYSSNAKVEFVLSSATTASGVANDNIIDRETVPVVKDGLNGQPGESAHYIYLKGTASDASDPNLHVNNETNVDGGTGLATHRRGLNLVTINRQTLAMVEATYYDTYGSSAESGAGVTNLITKLNSLDTSVFVCLTSYDAIGWKSSPTDTTMQLISVLKTFGMSDLPYTSTGRYPFLFIGYKNLGEGNGITRMRDAGSYLDFVELSAYVANGALTTRDGRDGQDGTNGQDAAAVSVSKTPILFITDSDAKAVGAQRESFNLQLLVNGTACTLTSIAFSKSNMGSIVLTTSSTGTTNVSSPITSGLGGTSKTLYLYAASGISIPSGSVLFTVTGTLSGVTYTAKGAIVVGANKAGASITGKTGPSPYYLGEWADKTDPDYIANGTVIASTDYERPFVSYTVGDSVTYFLYIGTSSMTTSSTRNNPASDTAHWEQMSSQNKYIIAEAIFSKFAKLGAAVFNEDWMFSAYGAGYETFWSGMHICNNTSDTQVGNSTSNSYSDQYNHFSVIAGQQCTVLVNGEAYVSGAKLRVAVFYYDGSRHSGIANLFITATTTKTYALTFVAERSGEAYVVVRGAGTTSNNIYGYIYSLQVEQKTLTEYQKMSPTFINDSTIVLWETNDGQGGITVSDTSIDETPQYLSYTPLYLVTGKKYRISVLGNVNAASMSLYVKLLQGTTTSLASNDYLRITSQTKAYYDAEFTATVTGEARIAAYVGTAGKTAYVFGVKVAAIDPFIPKVAVDWMTGYAHFAGGNAGFRPDGTMFLRSGYVSGFLRNIPMIIDDSNLDEMLTTNNAWLKYTSFGAAAVSFFGAGDSPDSVDLVNPTPVINLNKSGATMVFKVNPGHIVIHLPFLCTVFKDQGYNNFANIIGNADVARREQAKARSYVGSSVEIYNVSGGEIYAVGAYNGYSSSDAPGATASNYVPMSTDADKQNALSKIHHLPNGDMVRLTCKRLVQGNMFNPATGGGQEIIYWEAEAGAIGFTANDFNKDDYEIL